MLVSCSVAVVQVLTWQDEDEETTTVPLHDKTKLQSKIAAINAKTYDEDRNNRSIERRNVFR